MKDDGTLSTVTQARYNNMDDEFGFDNSTLPLSGRSKEILKLLGAYHDMLYCNSTSLSKKAIVVVHGESGSGKTSLVETLREPVSNSNGFFITGKFFQPSDGVKHEPHSAIMAAFSDLCDLVLLSDDLDSKRKLEIKKSIGSYAPILVRSISNLSPFIDAKIDFGYNDTINDSTLVKFRDACRQFLRAMSSEEHPIVLFLDDVQWMDEGSQMLIEMMLSKDDLIKKIYIVFAYRDDEPSTISNILMDREDIIDIKLSGLDHGSVNQIVSALLASPSPKVSTLSTYIKSRTMGNPFYVMQFMRILRKEGLIWLDRSNGTWIFDIKDIQKGMQNSDTLLEVLSRRIMHLSQAVQTALKIASMIGFFFSELVFIPVLTAELQRNPYGTITKDSKLTIGISNAHALVKEAIKEGFIEATKDGWQFCHDKLEASFQSLIEPSEKIRFHEILGNHYLYHRHTNDCICYAAFHLNKLHEYSKGHEHVDELARINLEAAKRCRDISAFLKAMEWSRKGLAILNEEEPEEKWKKNFKVTLELTEILAKMEFVTGNLENCKQLNQEAIQHCPSVDSKINSLVINIEANILSHNKSESMKAIRKSLRELGISFPRRVNWITFFLKLRRVRALLTKISWDEIENLPTQQNPRIATSVKCLVNLFSYCSLRNDETLAMFAGLMAMELTLIHGLSSHSATAFVLYGIVEAFFGHSTRALRCGDLAMKVMKKNLMKTRECPTVELYLSFISHFEKPLQHIVPVLEDTLHEAVNAGDVIYGGFCVAHSFLLRFFLGESLISLERSLRSHHSQIKELSLDAMTWWSEPCLQFAINMRSSTSKWFDLTKLSGEIMDEDEFTSSIIASNAESMLIVFWLVKVYLAYTFGYYELALYLQEKIKSQKILTHTSYIGPFCNFLGAMTCFELFRNENKRGYLRKARKSTKAIKRFETMGSPNTSVFLMIVKAEETSIKSKDMAHITEDYSRAIDACAMEGLVHWEAMSHERLSYALLDLQNQDQSSCHLKQAIDIYGTKWGATAKSDWLRMIERNRCLDP